jgi:hypothetical protein
MTLIDEIRDKITQRQFESVFLKSIPSPKISEIRAVEYHAFFIRRKKKAQKETTAHAGYSTHFRLFKPMS